MDYVADAIDRGRREYRVNHLTFRSSRIIYYGPHECQNCGVMICKMGQEFGGNAFTYPDGAIYPNTEWHPHVCDPKLASRQKALRDSRPGNTPYFEYSPLCGVPKP